MKSKKFYLNASVFVVIVIAGLVYFVTANAKTNTTVVKVCLEKNGQIDFIDKDLTVSRCERNHGVVLLLGSQSSVGPQGPAGPQGPIGPAGKDGINGLDGAPGLQGPKGDPGEQGEAGKNGVDGVDGTPGVTGLQGEPGLAGEDGVDGVSGWEKVPGVASDDVEGLRTVTATCTAGKKVIGGGYFTFNVSSSAEIVITENYPSDDQTWTVRGGVDGPTTSGDESYSLQAYAICVSVL